MILIGSSAESEITSMPDIAYILKNICYHSRIPAVRIACVEVGNHVSRFAVFVHCRSVNLFFLKPVGDLSRSQTSCTQLKNVFYNRRCFGIRKYFVVIFRRFHVTVRRSGCHSLTSFGFYHTACFDFLACISDMELVKYVEKHCHIHARRV